MKISQFWREINLNLKKLERQLVSLRTTLFYLGRRINFTTSPIFCSQALGVGDKSQQLQHSLIWEFC